MNVFPQCRRGILPRYRVCPVTRDEATAQARWVPFHTVQRRVAPCWRNYTGLWQEEFALLWNTDATPSPPNKHAPGEDAWDFARWCVQESTIRWAALNGHIVPGNMIVSGHTVADWRGWCASGGRIRTGDLPGGRTRQSKLLVFARAPQVLRVLEL